MSTQSSKFDILNRGHQERKLKLLELYASRRPMDQLPNRYRITDANLKPPVLHFAFPLKDTDLYDYAEKHDLNTYYSCAPNWLSPTTMFGAAEHLSEKVQYELEFGFPFGITADCDVLLGLYSNYSIEDKKLIEEDEEDVIQMVQEQLGLAKSVRPRWYFDVHDEWEPEDSDDDTE